jgi:hypothetical protein
MSDDKNSPSPPDVKDTHQVELAPGTIRIELVQSSKWSVAFLSLLLLCAVIFGVAWIAIERSTARILHPESFLSVLELETSTVKIQGIDGHFTGLTVVQKSDLGITFDGFTRLGVDLSKAKFDLDRLRGRLVITLPAAEVGEVCVAGTKTWERNTNKNDAKKLDELEVELCNGALDDFRNMAKEKDNIIMANHLAKVILQAYYKRNYPGLKVEFRRPP